MGVFAIIYNSLPPVLMPVRLRTAIHKAWLRAMVNGSVGVLYGSFTAMRNANVYRLSHTSQVCYMEAALNDIFDSTLRRIYIADAMIVEPVWIYTVAEGHPVALYTDGESAPIALYTAGEVAASVAGFVVWVPTGLVYDVVRLRALVNLYRLPSMTNWVIRVF
jgi:hypothetical protein